MILRRALRLLFAVALLVAWQSSLDHPVAHVDGHGGLVHVAGVLGGHDSGDGEANALCDAIAAVAACVPGIASNIVVPDEGNSDRPRNSVAAFRTASSLAYRSQAPPSLL